MKARNFSGETLKNYRRTAGMWVIWCGDNAVALDRAEHGDVERWLDSRRLGPRARYAYTSVIATFYSWLIREEHLERNPTLRVDRPRLGRYLPRPAPSDAVSDALAAAEPRVVVMVALGAFAGMRRAEISRTRVEDLLLANEPPVILIHGKGGRERLVPLHDEVLAALRIYGVPKAGWLFPSPTGRGLTPTYIGTLITAALGEAHGHVTTHQLRHAFGTGVYRDSLDLRLTQELLGHASPATTAIYTAFSQPRAAEVVTGLPSRLAPAPPAPEAA